MRFAPGKENLCAMTENMQADDVQRRKPRVVRCCLYFVRYFRKLSNSAISLSICSSVPTVMRRWLSIRGLRK